MIPQITLVILVGFLFVVQGFVVSPGTEIWRRQSFGSTSSTPTIISSTSRIRGCWSNGNPRVGHTRPGYVRMSVNDMLGADVESNGIFDPLGVFRGIAAHEDRYFSDCQIIFFDYKTDS